MKIRLTELRQLIKKALIQEMGANGGFPGAPYGRNTLSPSNASREQLSAMSAKAMDTVGDDDDLPEHLREPTVEPADCYGPVPPDAEPVYVGSDPFTRDADVTPTSNIKRGPTRV